MTRLTFWVDIEDVVGTRLPTTVIERSPERDLCYSAEWAPSTELLIQEQFRPVFYSPSIDPLSQLEGMFTSQFQNLYASIASLYAKA